MVYSGGVEIWAYCLMPNHIHLIAVPHTQDGLQQAIGEAHRRYTRQINFREKWRGYLWQGRFASFIMDKPYLSLGAEGTWNAIRREPTRSRPRRVAMEQHPEHTYRPATAWSKSHRCWPWSTTGGLCSTAQSAKKNCSTTRPEENLSGSPKAEARAGAVVE